MFRISLLGLIAALTTLATLGQQTCLFAAPPFADEDVARLRKVIRPQTGEDPFDSIPWETSLWDARVKAAAAGKPVMLWEMDGHPLGCGWNNVVTGRVSAFADPTIIQLIKTEFVPVSGDDWYQRRRQDKEGVFFRSLADALGKTGPGGDTRQGVYCFTGGGTPLAYRNAGTPVDLRQLLQQALNKFARLPERERTPGGVTVEAPGKPDPEFVRLPPQGGLVLNVYTRILDYKNGEYCKGSCKQAGGDRAARDHAWLTAEEVQALAPAKPTVGFRYPVPPPVAERLLRFHLVDNTSGEPVHWRRDEIRSKRLTLKVVGQSPEAIDLRLEGEALMTNKPEAETADRGYEVRLLGSLRYLPGKKAFDRFDVTAIGSHWGEAFHSGFARPGRSLLGVSFELAGDRPGDKVPPQGAREADDYYGRK